VLGICAVVERGVVHHVADADDPAAIDALASQVSNGCPCRGKQQVGCMVGDDAVNLLGRIAVERAQAGLDVCEGSLQLRGGKRPGERRIGVSVDEHPVRPFLRQCAFECGQHAPGLRAVGTGPYPEIAVGPRDLEFPEKDGRHVVVVVLASVH